MIEYGNKFDSIFEYLIMRFGNDLLERYVTEGLPYILVAVNLQETCLILEEFSEWLSIEMLEPESVAHLRLTEDFKNMVIFKLL